MPFLERAVTRHPRLIQTAVSLHQNAVIPANTLLLDLAAFRHNADLMKDEAERVGLSLYFMTKQHGRNPIVYGDLTQDGRASTVSVDIQCARALHNNRIPLGHVGNLSQVPHGDLQRMVEEMRPEVISVFSIEKARAISEVAAASGVVQDILIRVRRKGDVVFPGMDGGFDVDADLEQAVEALLVLPGVRLVGVSTFPAIAYTTSDHPEATPNFETLRLAADRLRRLGIVVKQVNAPGNTCVANLGFLAEQGATHVEPGAALGGHATLNLTENSPERPGVVYVTEVSHFVDGRAWVFGGGFFLDDPPVAELADFGNRRNALVGNDPDTILDRRARLAGTGPEASARFGGIDYHGILDVDRPAAAVGDTAVFGFRTQAFVTRTNVAVIDDALAAEPELLGLFDVQGHRLDPSRWW